MILMGPRGWKKIWAKRSRQKSPSKPKTWPFKKLRFCPTESFRSAKTYEPRVDRKPIIADKTRPLRPEIVCENASKHLCVTCVWLKIWFSTVFFAPSRIQNRSSNIYIHRERERERERERKTDRYLHHICMCIWTYIYIYIYICLQLWILDIVTD